MAVEVIGAGLQVYQGMQAKAQAKAQRQMYEEERKNTLAAATSDEAARRTRLFDILATQQAIRAGRSVADVGPQGDAIAGASRAEAEADIGASQMTYFNRAERLRQAGDLALWQGKQAYRGALIGAGFGLLKSAASAIAGAAGAGVGAAIPGAYGAPGIFSASQLPRSLDGRIVGGV